MKATAVASLLFSPTLTHTKYHKKWSIKKKLFFSLFLNYIDRDDDTSRAR